MMMITMMMMMTMMTMMMTMMMMMLMMMGRKYPMAQSSSGVRCTGVISKSLATTIKYPREVG